MTNRSQFLIYKTLNGEIKIDVLLKNETIRMPQKKIAELFDVQRPAITKHLKNIFEEWELDKNMVSSILEHTTKHGAINNKTQTKLTTFYNLEAIIAVWYRVNSKRATQFRIWSTSILQEYIIKWFSMDDERLKNPQNEFWKDYFDEQLERIRDIRSSERRFYQKITDIYAKCSIDYDSKSETTNLFFATVQNKLHFAITGQTAAEIIKSRSAWDKQNMWLKTWKYAPNWIIRKTDIWVAKNYLTEKELKQLNLIVSMYLDFAELQALEWITMTMQDWISRLDDFLKTSRKELLTNSGSINHKQAIEIAKKEYSKYKKNENKKYISDFDKEMQKVYKTKIR